jgi:anti-sigma factor RsiW
MECKEFREQLGLYIDGELSAESADEAREHLKGCASCAKAEVGLRHLRSSLKRVVNRHQPPPELEVKVLRSLGSHRRIPAGRAADESRRVGTPVWRAQVLVPVPFLALLVLTLVALAGWLVFARRLPPSPPGQASGESYFSRFYRGERASIQVVRRASLESPNRGK